MDPVSRQDQGGLPTGPTGKPQVSMAELLRSRPPMPTGRRQLPVLKPRRPAPRRPTPVLLVPPPDPRPSLARMLLPGAGFLAVLGLLAAWLLAPPDTVERFIGTMPVDRQQLLAILHEHKTAWRPEDKSKAAASLQQAGPKLHGAVRWLLGEPRRAEVPQMIELAGDLRIASVLPELRNLTKDKELRAPALVAVDAIQPLTDPELTLLLDDKDRKVLLAAIEIAGGREAALLTPLVRLLASPHADVRNATLAALPARLPADVTATLLPIAGEAAPDVAVIGLRALARVPMTEDVEVFLAQRAWFTDPRIGRAALAALTGQTRPLGAGTQGRLWQIITDARSDQGIVGRALLCLERTRSIDAEQARRSLSQLDCSGRYFAARLLLAAGDPTGTEILFGLLGELPEGRKNESPRDAAVRFSVKALLAGLSRTHASDGEARWRAWFEQHPVVGPCQLPAPALEP